MSAPELVDVLIVGSGPSGISTALHLVRRDPAWAGRVVVVDKAVHPREKLCGGGLTHIGQNILANLGLALEPRNFPVNEVRLLYRNKSYSFYGNPVFRIVRRDEFDHWLVKTAEQLGVTVRQGEGVTAITPHEEYVEVVTERAVFHAKVLVAADGSRSFVRRKLKWEDDSRVARLVEVLTPEDPNSLPEFHDGIAVFDFTPMDDDLQGYYWDFPSYVKGQPYMNRGVFDSRAVPRKPKADLKEVLGESMAERGRDLDDYELKGHPIRWWSSDGRFAQPRVILVGDAAGADPLMGEGISFALGYGEPAADAIIDAFTRDDFSFAGYRERLLAHPLFKQLHIRTQLARLAYLLNYPIVVRVGWSLMRLFLRFTPWKDRDYVPARQPELRWIDPA
ncbi:MAG: NAD(P)/FAD-dependent oxidoreductase [Candidatus Promineofilum sp.]|nr:NAD(P)/FAD-dependent oxidoreductase [Promineifilum sp.]MCW5863392.1 NAD(P)/FAD-dependent oxidoreductase [Anaerolineae bacterium]